MKNLLTRDWLEKVNDYWFGGNGPLIKLEIIFKDKLHSQIISEATKFIAMVTINYFGGKV